MTAVADQPARDAIRQRLDVTMLVEAAAGTGKTTSLVDRMVNLVKAKRASPSTLAAITFTLKAAAQLREKFQEGLEKANETAAVAEIDRGFVGTTHAFCARLLRERPVEAGLDPEFEEVDEAVARQLTAEFWNRWYDVQVAAGNPLIYEARDVDLDRKTLRGSFERFVEHPDVTMISKRVPRPDLGALCDAVCAIVDEVVPHLPRGDPDDFHKLIVNVERKRRSSDLDDPIAQLEFLEEANHASSKAVQKRWVDGQQAKRFSLKYSEFVKNELRPGLVTWREHVHGIAIELLRPAAEAFAIERRRNGTLTFQDLLVCARDMLRDHPAVRRYLQRRFTHVLVDEFQDTDPLQAEVVFYLTGENVEEKNWRKLRPRPGSLFIVGDPKQSIYRFRRADITTYLDVRNQIERSGGEIVSLSTNFRSGQLICGFVNDAFKVLFTQDDVDAGRQSPHVDLSHVHKVDAPTGVYSLETPADHPIPMAQMEAARIAAWIRDSVGAGKFKYGDFLLVSWQRPRLSYYARALEALDIPYEITGSKAFDGTEELERAMPMLKAVAEPDDMVSLVAFLRGPLCGADDDALYRFVQAGGRFNVFRDPPPEADERIVRGLKSVLEAVKDSEKHPPAATIARLFDRVGLLPLAASGEQPGTRAGNLLLALSIAREESSRGSSLGTIVDLFEDLLASPPDIEELDVDPGRDDVVRLMNLHQVKGLEAPVVFLIDPTDPHEFDVDLVVERGAEETRGHFMVWKKWGKSKKAVGLPVGWSGYLENEQKFREAQRKRLLYVAATRAKKMLIIGFRTTKKGVDGAWRDLATRVGQAVWSAAAMPPLSIALPTPERATLQEARTNIAASFEIAKQTSYSVLPITKVAHKTHEALVKAEEGLGKGTSWGRVLHRLFEAMLRDESLDVRLYADNLLKDEERDPVELDEVLRVVDAVRGSKLWNRVKASPERYVEVPFALTVSRRAVGLEEDGDTLLHGTIDLVFRENDRWFIIDYKSDSTKGRLDSLVAYYKPQVEHYARFWSQLTKAPATAGLFFVDGAIERWVN